jgi:hypothetical protein
MNTYCVIRWGNPDDSDGPDGKDTIFLIRAATVEEASRLADARLKDMPTQKGNNRPVEAFSHQVIQISEGALGSGTPEILHGPWVSSAIFLNDNLPAWYRDDPRRPWGTWEECYGVEHEKR